MKSINLLIVDDEPIRFVLGRAFRLLGFNVTEAATGEEALSYLEAGFFDLMILDMELPGLKGQELISLANKRWPNLSIVVLTGHASVESAVSSLKSKIVVDYLQKSATLEEVIDAVADALHRRKLHKGKNNLARMMHEYPQLLSDTDPAPVSEVPDEEYQTQALFVRPLLLNRPDRSVKFVDKPDYVVTLSRGETAVLYTLMSHPDQVLSCRQIVQKVWGYDADPSHGQSVIRPYISRLRKKLEEIPEKPSLIHTVRNQGYMLVSQSN